MTSDPGIPTHRDDRGLSPLLRAAIWVAIGALIAAALICVVWVLVGSQNGIVGRAFLTILLLAGFAGVAILDAHLAPRRPAWFALASMGTWIVILLIGAVMIWMPDRTPWGWSSRFIQFLLIVLILQLALLHVRLYMKAFRRYVTAFTQTVAIVTIALVVALAALLVVPLVVSEWVRFADLYWRVVVAVAILAAVGTALIPLVNALFAPRQPRVPRAPAPAYGAAHPQGIAPAPAWAQLPSSAAPAVAASVAHLPEPAPTGYTTVVAPEEPELLPWPFFVDGRTPLPMLPDGSPDWAAYYTGQPSPGAQIFVPEGAEASVDPEPVVEPVTDADPVAQSEPESAAVSEAEPDVVAETPAGYEGFPPPPPLPPRS